MSWDRLHRPIDAPKLKNARPATSQKMLIS